MTEQIVEPERAAMLADATGIHIDQAAVLLQALPSDQAEAFLHALTALRSSVPVGAVMRNTATGETAVRTLSGPGGVPVWAIVPADSPWSVEHRPPELDGKWAEMSCAPTVTDPAQPKPDEVTE